jgi:hypothetical protein
MVSREPIRGVQLLSLLAQLLASLTELGVDIGTAIANAGNAPVLYYERMHPTLRPEFFVPYRA